MSRDFLDRLAARRKFGICPGLETMRALCAALGNPEREFAVIHIAGTNGKGSVAAICESALRTMGLPVARYTSPHLVRVNERFVIHGESVDDETLTSALDRVEAICVQTGLEPTFFEVLTACAWVLFRDAGIRLVVAEVGMGGRWDATNVIESPLVSVITHVALDHCAILGDTIEAIAGEKAGIIKERRPVVIGAMDPRARAVLLKVAAERHAPLHDAAEEIRVTVARRTIHGQTLQCSSATCDYPAALTRLAGSYQVENAATALCALERLNEQGLEIAPKAFSEGMRTVVWQGRCQLIASDPTTFLDGGHNPDALRALREALKSMNLRRNVALVCGFCEDKAVKDALREIAPIVSAAWTVPIANGRSLPSSAVAEAARGAGIPTVTAMASVSEAIEAATEWAQENRGTVLICGSLFLVGEVLILRGDAEGDTLDPSEQVRATRKHE
ncbi:MAG: folylpolyglutamate synthase/dihydrofolate synthase family protein [Kiritimatiellia bacterium]